MTMSMPNSAIPPLSTLDDARRKLSPVRRRKPAALKMLASAAIFALSTLLLAGSVILGPFWLTKDSLAAARAEVLGSPSGNEIPQGDTLRWRHRR